MKTLMRRMGIEVLYRRPRTTKSRSPATRSTRICCAGWRLTRPNQVWAMDITYIPMARGFVYLRPWCSTGSAGACCRGGVSITMEADRSASRRWRRRWQGTASRRSSTPTRARSSPAQPSPACSPDNGIAISMDGKGAWRDNVFVERLWRSVKYEEVYLRAYDSVAEARTFDRPLPGLL